MPMYEYKCGKCGEVSTFAEKMFHVEPLFFGRKKCPKCGSRKLTRVMSAFSAQPRMSYTDQLNELKSMGNVNFVPPPPKPAWGDGPPPGGCPYEKAAKEEQAKQDAAERERKAKEPIVIKGG